MFSSFYTFDMLLSDLVGPLIGIVYLVSCLFGAAALLSVRKVKTSGEPVTIVSELLLRKLKARIKKQMIWIFAVGVGFAAVITILIMWLGAPVDAGVGFDFGVNLVEGLASFFYTVFTFFVIAIPMGVVVGCMGLPIPCITLSVHILKWSKKKFLVPDNRFTKPLVIMSVICAVFCVWGLLS